MSDITHMGLPQGLPELSGYRSGYDPALNSYLGSQRQQAYNPPPKRAPPPAREMTAADLGLPLRPRHEKPWAYWSLGPQLVRLMHWDRQWAELSPWGIPLDQAIKLRDGLNYAIKQAEAAAKRGDHG
jgi:hypothetical protein